MKTFDTGGRPAGDAVLASGLSIAHDPGASALVTAPGTHARAVGPAGNTFGATARRDLAEARAGLSRADARRRQELERFESSNGADARAELVVAVVGLELAARGTARVLERATFVLEAAASSGHGAAALALRTDVDEARAAVRRALADATDSRALLDWADRRSEARRRASSAADDTAACVAALKRARAEQRRADAELEALAVERPTERERPTSTTEPAAATAANAR